MNSTGPVRPPFDCAAGGAPKAFEATAEIDRLHDVRRTVGERGQLELPAAFCQRLDIQPGDEVLVKAADDRIVVE